MDHYHTLGVTRDATKDDIKKKFRELAKKAHPDCGGDLAKFQEITLAYEVLSDDDKRTAYDNPAPQFSFGSGDHGVDLSDIFAQAFGQQFGQRFDFSMNGRPAPGQGFNNNYQQQTVYRTTVSIPLSAAYYGAEQTFSINIPGGSSKTIKVKVPLSTKTGDQIRLSGLLGDNSFLIVEFNVQNDSKFERRGTEFHSEYPISVLDLITGKTVKFVTFSGNTIEIDIPAGTQPNINIQVPGYGMPMGNGTYGDQFLRLTPFVPNNIHEDIIVAINRSYTNEIQNS